MSIPDCSSPLRCIPSAALVRPSEVHASTPNYVRLSPTTLGVKRNLCPGTRDATEPTAAFCTSTPSATTSS